ncbi:hypothetical protein SERLADRAFT_440390 [Serpula lacrymans var. lacrymans S7.9]|uniref:Protein kinase domain-containing protein n=1 Tax=Serpula lacrymans var. lacrymans (strain S7.9) TaxID=578457 RepID=F8P2I5_SERL9|nr:uncharacterized protein SERLADRAFT_440390 [Serpula lacrymans var. lacrymans S7.9]EGO22370.1 hypothetical protein SERLADRAFT_440390 [Serpula lacrymans var. lacrymans S7.9]
MPQQEPAAPADAGRMTTPMPDLNGAHLEIELTGSISEGRIGLAYSARVIHNTADLDLPDLCIKLVKPKYGRTLAREAWFYEQLAREPGYEGVVTPRCFGFFTVPLKDCLDVKGQPVSHIKPWENITLNLPEPDPEDTDESAQKEDRDWWLPNDPSGLDGFFKDDDGWKSGSPWNKWRASPSEPFVCVLVLEKLGKFYISPQEYIGNKVDEREEVELNDIRDVVRDVSSTRILHRDLRYCNIVRAPNDVICSRHGRAHQWRLIDFDIAAKVYISPETPVDSKYAQDAQVRVIGTSSSGAMRGELLGFTSEAVPPLHAQLL